jgi:predicted amidohydrolase YtcJ
MAIAVSTFIADAEVDGTRCHVRIDAGRIAELDALIRPRRDETVVDAHGGALLPGLHDHHIHLRALAANEASLPLGPPAVRDRAAFTARLIAAATETPTGSWIRAVGYHESVAGPLDRHVLDAIVGPTPVRVQHATGSQWTVNSAGLACLGAEEWDEPGVERDPSGRATGTLRRLDRTIATKTRHADDLVRFRALAQQAARWGITGFTDADPDRTADDLGALAEVLDRGGVPQRICAMAPPDVTAATHPRLSLGPQKIILDDDDLPTIPALTAHIGRAHQQRWPIAVHCVTRVQLIVTLAALAEVGTISGDRIEHAAIVPPELADEIARLGLTVVTQPGFIAARGDRYRTDVDPVDLPHLYRCRSLLERGIGVAFGSDAPYGPADPWRVMRAAMTRQSDGGSVLGVDERVDGRCALDRWLGSADRPERPRRLAVGAVADLCLLRAPLAEVIAEPDAEQVAATFVDGEMAYDGTS